MDLQLINCAIRFARQNIQFYYTYQSSRAQSMNRSRPSSQASSTHSSQKPGFQTKMRPRIKGASSFQDHHLNMSTSLNKKPSKNQTHQLQISMNLDNRHQETPLSQFQSQQTSRSQRPTSQLSSPQHNSQFNKTASQLSMINFSQHCSPQCICQQCSCGRHLCKLSNVKPDLSKSTVYEKDFGRKSSTPAKIVFAKEYDQLDGPHLLMNSTQRLAFNGKKGDQLERPKPEDLLKSQGPSQALTSYSSQFPGHKGANQYIKPTDKHIRDKFPLRSKSTYSDTFGKKDLSKDDYKYIDDQLKTGGNWYGNSSYGKFFVNPNPEYHAKKVKVVEKREQNPRYKHQYETTYKNDFVPKQSAVCGSKIMMQTRGRGSFSVQKERFAQNSDFKGMSPQFQSFSRSGFSFV